MTFFSIQTQKEVFRVILAIAMVVAGILHFTAPEPFVRIVPSALPYPLMLVYISGGFEILAGIGLLIPPVSQVAAWGLIMLFIAVFPANVNMAINHITIDGIPNFPMFHAIRLPFQGVLIAWAWWLTRPTDPARQASLIPRAWWSRS